MTDAQAYSKSLLDRATDYVKTGKGLDDLTTTVAELKLPIGGEADARVEQVSHVVRLLEAYQKDPKEVRPLSIVVFGPPGSGKSRFVKEITKAVEGYAPVKTTNLTQIESSEELARFVKDATGLNGSPARTTDNDLPPTPTVFFDEFDAARDGKPLGWLSWFLAPMEDGTVQFEGKEVEIGKAVFMFAGGTAETLDEFNQHANVDPETYRARKVPDFISRLRGSVEIGGVNDIGDARIVPRALALQYHLKDSPFQLNDGQIRQFLTNGHFVHGIRSLRTLIAAWDQKKGAPDLPDAIRKQHLGRGELDQQVIGISAGLIEPKSDPMLLELTRQLLRNGATLAYAGALLPDGTLKQVMDAAKEAPQDLVSDEDRGARVRSYLGYPASKLHPVDTDVEDVDFIPLVTIGASELEELGAPTDAYFAALPIEVDQVYNPHRHVAWALSLFRLRVRLLQDVSALVVLGGKDDGRSWGRTAGIAEEVMIALALRKPVYVLSWADGAARAVGRLLGLDGAPVNVEQCLKSSALPGFDDALAPFASSFDIPGIPASPRNTTEIRRFLFHRGLTTSAWSWNGLTPTENRKLFAYRTSDDAEEVKQAVSLILRGLSRIEWNPRGGGRTASHSTGAPE
jgi:hypothetical protein